ncbi:3-hydroxyisobutyryl-CoA hydrolase [Cystobasidium minutum MCA 4210]|uniref:mitochondrial 37S ribosomal protein mS47 n=1 Tax=Cystobasidium minutum MCA 4210 TaxID=1397322 RepID=UPI0034CF9E0D|eukprot:jgi/Rhomi1/193113/gm1.1327_g
MAKSAAPKTSSSQKAVDLGEERAVKTSSNQGARIMTLNNPKGLNALNKAMIDIMQPQLQLYEKSPSCHLIILKGEGKGFCAGGDVKALVRAVEKKETRKEAVDFFKDEYTLDREIALMKKPVISFMDGATMGGGVGISVHAPFRIATENTVFAMPETDIGLFPDVGASFFLSRLDGQIGTYLGLTGTQLSGYDVYRAGIATHYVPSDRLEALEDRLASLNFSADAPSTSMAGQKLISSAIEEFVADAETAANSSYKLVGAIREVIDKAFDQARVPLIVQALQEAKEKNPEVGEWVDATLKKMDFVSPTSLAVALEAIRAGKDMNISEVFERDLRLASVFCNPDVAPDFVAGVTQRLLGPKEDRKKRAPWKPSSISEITHDDIRRTFFSAPNKSSPSLPPLQDKTIKLYSQYPHAYFALPSEKLIGRVVRGDTPDSGSFALSKDEVLDWFEREWNGKIGVKEKVREVLQRRTKTMQDGTLQWK